MTSDTKEKFGLKKKFVIGMVHCLALPTTMGYAGDCKKIIERAVSDAKTLERGGVDAVMVENMCDGPFSALLNTAQIAALSAVVAHVRQVISIPVGVDAAFNDCKASLAIAKFNGCQFIRVPVFVDTVEFTDGIILPCARTCMTYRKELGAEDIMVFGDIQVKHTNMIVPVPIEQSAKNAVDCGADAIIVTGSTTGAATPMEMIERTKKVVEIPVIVGSGITAHSIDKQLDAADGAIVGSGLKQNGLLTDPIDFSLVKELMQNLHR